ncbi:Heat shock 70 kDa protein [Orchesella cincta]|uniref:Heat shock 70 kDa protein n=1 Tax=Orchesella cincta TaxID=48709 RepID=A0A1D2MNU1_ORCCI|nr:Heat shock 70 kDa protein [Orchesella cincta]
MDTDCIAKALPRNISLEKTSHVSIKHMLDDILVQYDSELNAFLEHNKFAELQELKVFHENLKCNKLSNLTNSLELSGESPKLIEESKIELHSLLDQEFNDHEEGHKHHMNEIKSETDKFIRGCSKTHKLNLKKLINTCKSFEELKKFHDDSVSTFMKSFSTNGNPYPTSCNEHPRVSQKLLHKFEKVFEEISKQIDEQRLSYKETMNTAIVDYISQYQHEISLAEGRSKDMIGLHSQLLNKGKRELQKKYTMLKIPRCCHLILSEFEELLESKLKASYETLKIDNTPTQWINEAIVHYENIMKSKLSEAENLYQLKNYHIAAKDSAGELLIEKCSESKDEDGLLNTPWQLLVSQLELKVDLVFREFKDLFRRQDLGAQKIIDDTLQKAKEHYKNEMRIHFKNNKFIHPERLEELHNVACSYAVTRFVSDNSSSHIKETHISELLEHLYQDYKKKNDMNYNSKLSPSIGIDLGTTNCCVGVHIDGETIIVPDVPQGTRKITPSYVAFTFDEAGNSKISYGSVAKKQTHVNLENTIFDVKRIIGKPFNDKHLQKDMYMWPFTVVKGKQGQPMIQIEDTQNVKTHLYAPSSISALLLKRLRENVEAHLKLEKSSITQAVITVPAYFNNDQRQATVDAGIIAGFEKVDILTEPIAAAFAYKLHRSDKQAKKVLIYDLGGGTFDVAVMDVELGIEVLAIGGDTHLGGNDFDKELVMYCAKEFSEIHKVNAFKGEDSSIKPDRDAFRRRFTRLQKHCEKAKKQLSTASSTVVCIDAFFEGIDLNLTVTKKKFEELNDTYFQKTINIVHDTLEGIHLKKEDIDDVILVGGSTRIPRVCELIQKHFNGKALNYSVHADEAVAFGAARQAAILSGENARQNIDMLAVQDVSPMSLGTEILGGFMSTIIPKYTKIPTSLQDVYTTVRDNQTSVGIKIFQGENHIAEDNSFLGKFILSGLPEGLAGTEKFYIRMNLTSMGILRVSAVSKTDFSLNADIIITEESLRSSEKDVAELKEKVTTFGCCRLLSPNLSLFGLILIYYT